MKDEQKNWFPHLKDAVPHTVDGYDLCRYTIALEGWRRGLKLKFYTLYFNDKLRVRFSLSDKDKMHKFSISKGDMVSQASIDICREKYLTKKYLSTAGVPVPKGKKFTEEIDDKKIVKYAKSLGFPIALKPTTGNDGKGVIANIRDEHEIREALRYVREDLKSPTVLVEQHISGKEHRVYVVDDHVIGAVNRRPANVIGDGEHTIEDLIHFKNKERKRNPQLRGLLIKINNELLSFIRKSGFTLESVLKKNERIYLSNKSNLSAGGESIDSTDELTTEHKHVAINAVKAVPELPHCGVDMIVNEYDNSSKVLELNANPGISGHLFPMEGEARDIPRAIIDYYFPETVNNSGNIRGDVYFDYRSIKEYLQSGVAKEVTLPSIPKHRLYAKKYTVSGKVQGVGYRNWVQKQAVNFKLNGFVKNLKNGEVSIVAAGEKANVDKFKEIIRTRGPQKAGIKSVIEKDWNKPINIGFEKVKRKGAK